MIYIEYFQREPDMPLEVFRHFGDHGAWGDPDDTLYANLSRTMRIGPHPSNMALWQCKGLNRMDDWESYFRSEEGRRDLHEQASLRALNLMDGGCYDEVVEGPRPNGGLQYVEFFDFPAELDTARIAEAFAARAESHDAGTLNLVLRRIGLLGPPHIGDPAVWTFPSYAAAEAIFRERHPEGPLRPIQAGVYRRFGQEAM